MNVAGGGPASALESLAFLDGEWTAEFRLFEEMWGATATTTRGWVKARYAGGGAWFELDSGAGLPAGPYVVKVLVVAPPPGDELRAFVVNSFRSGVAYEGDVRADGAVVFEGAIGQKIQRVTYEPHGVRVRFFVEESHDDRGSWLPHSEAWWTPGLDRQDAAE